MNDVKSRRLSWNGLFLKQYSVESGDSYCGFFESLMHENGQWFLKFLATVKMKYVETTSNSNYIIKNHLREMLLISCEFLFQNGFI